MKQPPWLLVPRGERLEVGAAVALTDAEARHATGPLRLRTGDPVVLADGAGVVAGARLREASRSRVEAEVTTLERMPQPGGRGVTLAIAVVENRAMEWLVQKAVEVGVRRLEPILSDRTQPGSRDVARRSQHWERVAMQALKQCRRPWAMSFAELAPLADLLERTAPEVGVVADPGGGAVLGLPPSEGWVLAVGPEGGFSPAESRLFVDRGWHRLRLGPHVLRAETAAVVGGALLVAHLEGGR